MTSKIKTVEDAFMATNRDPNALPEVSNLPVQDQQDIIDNYKLKVVVEALNTESNGGKPWKPNYNDHNEIKWEPLFGVSADKEHPAGFGFSVTHYDYWYAATGVGSRLCFHSKEVMQYAQEQFKDLYLRVILGVK